MTPRAFYIRFLPMRRHFHPDDFPAYTFAEDGTPTRTAAPKTGPYAGIPNRQPAPFTRKSDGRECFNLTRADGAIRIVSRDLIRAAVSPFDAPEDSPPELPPWSFLIEGFEGYALVLDPISVIRFWSPAVGTLNPPTVLKSAVKRYHRHGSFLDYITYTLVDCESGTTRRVNVEKLKKLAGVSDMDIRLAHARSLASRTASPTPEPRIGQKES